MEASDIKDLVLSLGADLCGIAPGERFDSAPDGFRPKDLYDEARSVIVFAKRVPESVLHANSCIPYSFADDVVTNEILKISIEVATKLGNLGIIAVPIPSTPYDYWDEETMTGKGLLSLKHAGYLAGLGVIGRNTLLCNKEYGNMIKLGALITNIELEPDSIMDHDFCSDKCNLCIDGCPSGALGKNSVIQKNCRLYSETTTSKGAPITVCYNCRKVCPNRNGWKL
jgi:epoxyqueuosine reductase